MFLYFLKLEAFAPKISGLSRLLTETVKLHVEPVQDNIIYIYKLPELRRKYEMGVNKCVYSHFFMKDF